MSTGIVPVTKVSKFFSQNKTRTDRRKRRNLEGHISSLFKGSCFLNECEQKAESFYIMLSREGQFAEAEAMLL